MPKLSDGAPFIAVGNDELRAPLGPEVSCPHCKGTHPVKHSDGQSYDAMTGEWVTGTPNLLQFYRCGTKTYLAGIQGRAWK